MDLQGRPKATGARLPRAPEPARRRRARRQRQHARVLLALGRAAKPLEEHHSWPARGQQRATSRQAEGKRQVEGIESTAFEQPPFIDAEQVPEPPAHIQVISVDLEDSDENDAKGGEGGAAVIVNATGNDESSGFVDEQVDQHAMLQALQNQLSETMAQIVSLQLEQATTEAAIAKVSIVIGHQREGHGAGAEALHEPSGAAPRGKGRSGSKASKDETVKLKESTEAQEEEKQSSTSQAPSLQALCDELFSNMKGQPSTDAAHFGQGDSGSKRHKERRKW